MVNVNKTYNALCQHSDCCKAETCQRQIKYQKQLATEVSFNLLNPSLTPKITSGEDCEFFISNAPIVCGKGLLRLTKEMASGKLDAFRNRMCEIYPRNKYFLIRRGEHLCTPEEQQTIVRILSSLDALPSNYSDNPLTLFDETVEIDSF